MATVAAVLVCLILLSVGVSSDSGSWSCGSVLSSEKGTGDRRLVGCSAPLDGRLTLSLVVGAVGVAAFFGSTQINKREDD